MEEYLVSNDSSSSGISNATSLKMLLAKEMAKEVESKRRCPSVIARLMGIGEDLPAEVSFVHHARSDAPNSKATNKAQGGEHHQSMRLMPQERLREYKDVYEVCEHQSGINSFQDRTPEELWFSENKSEHSDNVQGKFMKPKHFAMEEKLPHRNELQHALKVPSSKNGFVLELPEECNSRLSRHPSRLHKNQAPPLTKRITVLKPVTSAEISDVRQSQTERLSKQNGLEMGQFHHSSMEETLSQPSRIIVLRPTPGKPGISKAKLTPKRTSFQLPKCNNLSDLSCNEAIIGSSGLVHDVKQHRHNGCHQRDEGYVGDESSCGDSEVDRSSGSEIDYHDEAGGSSDSEGNSSPWNHSCNYIRGYEGLSSSSFRDVPESSIIREAKKQLSERWAIVNSDDICQEKLQSSRRTCTLGEMLSFQEGKKEVCTRMLPVSSDQSCDIAKEPPARSTYIGTSRSNVATSPRNLARENSVPVISSKLDSKLANVKLSSPEMYKPKVFVISDKGKISFKGGVSDSKRPIKQKSAYYPSNCYAQKIVQRQLDHNLSRDANKKAVHCEDKLEGYSMQVPNGISERAVSLDPPSGNLDKLPVNDGLNSNPDQPSPTSVLVLDAPSEDSSCNEPEKSGRTSKNATVEAVACSLSWDSTTSESQLLCTRRPTSLISEADTDEPESHVLVQNILSSSGLGGAQSSMSFTGWNLSDHPLDPGLCNKILELREHSSYRRLLFDCVNAALVEIGENTLLSVLPCTKAHSRTLKDSSAPDLRVEVWSILKDWIYGARMFVVSKKGNAGILLDRIVEEEVEGRGWEKMMTAQVIHITEELEWGVMEELVEEALLDFSACFNSEASSAGLIRF